MTARQSGERNAPRLQESTAAPVPPDGPVAEPLQGRHDEESADETIRKRAYFLFRERGGAPGYELEDWLRAEREHRSATDL